MGRNQYSVTLSDAAAEIVETEMTEKGIPRSTAINELIVFAASHHSLLSAAEKTINASLSEFRQDMKSELEKASAPMIKAAKSLNSSRKSSSQARQAAVANLVMLSTLAPSIFEMETLAEGSDTTAYQLTQDNITAAELMDWFWMVGGMLADGRRGGINSTAAKNISVTAGRDILGGNRGSAYSLFTQAAMSEVEPPEMDDEYYLEEEVDDDYE